MSRKFVFLGVLALVLAPGGAFSLGLGDIRLNSYLNQPLDAEIALSVASAQELETLKVELASRDTFDRYGLARPAFLDDLEFRISRGPGGALVSVTSSRPILEPFVTFLLEARWAGGRVLREYTVLLDPPVYLPGEQAAPAVEAPAPVRSAPLRQPAPVAETRPAPAPAPVAPPRAVGAEYGPVQRNETLWGIAERVRPDDSLSMNQTMIALYRANPQAFDGNVNRLRAGAILRVPSRQDINSISRAEASADFRRQTRDWRESRGQPAQPAQARLELVPPAETKQPAAPAAGPSAPPSGVAGTSDGAAQAELLSAVQDLRGELDETRRMMEIKDAEIAALQARLAELEAGRAAAPAEGAPEAPAGQPTEAPADVAPVEEAPEEEAAPPPAAQPEPEPKAVTPPAPVKTAPSLIDRLLGFLGSLWFWVILGLVLVGGAALHFARNRGTTSSIEEDLAETGTWGTLEASKAAPAVVPEALSETQKLRALKEESEAIIVDERQTPEEPAPMTPRPAQPEAEAADDEYRYPFEDTIAGEAGINLDQSDPLAEADFHMAYGLYDQAAEIIKKAIEREPQRYDLGRKLLDICFVWGNADEFLTQARALKRLGGEEHASDWPKIAIMGRQICPGEGLFEGPAQAAPDLDVDLEAGGDTQVSAEGEDEWLDFDVGEAEAGDRSVGDTQEQPALGEPEVIPVPVDDTLEVSVAEAEEEDTTAEQTAELNIEELGIDLDLSETGEHALKELAERAPELPDETAYMARPEEEEATPAPEEIPIEDTDATVAAERPEIEDISSDEEAEGATMIQPMQASGGGEAEDILDDDLRLDDLTEGVDLDLGEEVAEEEAPRVEATVGDLEPGDDDTQEMPPLTMSEVGTKLDLARAYIDMGDPDGAKSILEEVLAEGDDGQKTEARELIESLG